jgi:hypothetical protein
VAYPRTASVASICRNVIAMFIWPWPPPARAHDGRFGGDFDPKFHEL